MNLPACLWLPISVLFVVSPVSLKRLVQRRVVALMRFALVAVFSLALAMTTSAFLTTNGDVNGSLKECRGIVSVSKYLMAGMPNGSLGISRSSLSNLFAEKTVTGPETRGFKNEATKALSVPKN